MLSMTQITDDRRCVDWMKKFVWVSSGIKKFITHFIYKHKNRKPAEKIYPFTYQPLLGNSDL